MVDSAGYPNVVAGRSAADHTPTDIKMDPTSFALYTGMWVWNTTTLVWEKMTQPVDVYRDDEIVVPATVTEDVFHYAVHEGLAFSAWDINTSGDAWIVFRTPNSSTYLHVLWSISAENNATFKAYKGVTAQAGGADLAAAPKNDAAAMNGGAVSAVIAGQTSTAGSVQVGQVPSDLGTLVYAEFQATGGGAKDAAHELVLEKNIWYGFKLEDIGSKDLGITLTWFEVPLA